MSNQPESSAASCCIIGAGPSGMTVAKRLQDYGIGFDWFEASDAPGGNWYYENPNGMSACYASLHIDTSKNSLAFEDFPIPQGWPDFPHHSQLLAYFNAYIDHFGLRGRIRFNTRVTRAHRDEDGRWSVTASDGVTRRYDHLMVCNGHHWDPRWPDPAYPGHFDGEQIHSHQYRSPFAPVEMMGKRILVVGAGNSSMDISSELSQRALGTKLFVSMRHGVWIFPKYIGGQPVGQLPPRIPRAKLRKLIEKRVLSAVGQMSDYGLPEPDHKPWQSHGTASGEFLLRAGSGDLTVLPGIERLDGKRVIFTDGTAEEIDVIIWATGYKISFPFFDQPEFKADEANVPPRLFKRMMIPGVSNLFYFGLAQASPTLVNFAEQQSKLAAEYLTGGYALPSRREMLAAIDRDERYYTADFYASPRHTIQAEFVHYVDQLQMELARGRRRASKRAA